MGKQITLKELSDPGKSENSCNIQQRIRVLQNLS